MVGHNPGALNNRPLLDNLVRVFSLHPRDKENTLSLELVKPAEVQEATIHHQNRSLRIASPARNRKFRVLSRRNDQRFGQVTSMIQRDVQLDGTFQPGPVRPREHLHAQRHDTGVDTQQRILKAESCFPRSQFATTVLDCVAEDPFKQLPRPMLVRIGQRRTLRSLHSPLLEPALTAGQPSCYFPQRLRVAQMAIQHRYEMVPAGESTAMPLRPCRVHCLLEFCSRKYLEQLRHDAAKSFHGTDLLLIA